MKELDQDRRVPGALDELTMDELTDRLRGAVDLDCPEDDGPEADAVLAAMMDKLAQEPARDGGVDVDAAWTHFQQRCVTPRQGTGRRGKDGRKPGRLLRLAVAAAAVAALLVVPVRGYSNAAAFLAHWTAERLYFDAGGQSSGGPGDPADKSVPAEFAPLKQVLDQNGIPDYIIPTYIPQEFVVADCAEYYDYAQGNYEFVICYMRGDDVIVFSASQHSDSAAVEKDDKPVEQYSHGDRQYLLFTNLSMNVAAWKVNDLDCTLGTTLSQWELKKMIDSIC